MSQKVLKTKWKKSIIFRIILAVLIVVVIIFGSLWNRYINKNSLISLYKAPSGQEVYLLGTFHSMHFNKWVNYSMEDLLNVVENLQPDIIFIEAREETFEEWGVVDGPIDMALIYAYSKDNNIPVEMIDWWVVDNDSKANTTNDKRDDMIFSKIKTKLDLINSDLKVLVVCGSGHFYQQSKRFAKNYFERLKLGKKANYFTSNGRIFSYPTSVQSVWEKRSYFYAYTHPALIKQNESLSDEIKKQFISEDPAAFYRSQLRYNELFSNDLLYEEKR